MLPITAFYAGLAALWLIFLAGFAVGPRVLGTVMLGTVRFPAPALIAHRSAGMIA